MLTVELKVNGGLIGFIKIVNRSFTYNGEHNYYKYSYYNVDKDTIIRGSVLHKRADGALTLLNYITEDISKKESENCESKD